MLTQFHDLQGRVSDDAVRYRNASPFPFIVLDDFLTPTALKPEVSAAGVFALPESHRQSR